MSVRCFMAEPVGDGSNAWRRIDTGEVFARNADLPPGAMWDAAWYRDAAEGKDDSSWDFFRPVDGKNLIVRLPNGHDWYIDGRASNCTDPDRPHRCWIRHGTPPNITVDKSGDTCSAGGGSILSGNYHGFLRNGVFEP